MEKMLHTEESNAQTDSGDLAFRATPEVLRLKELSAQHGLDLSSLRRALLHSSTNAATKASVAASQRVSRSPASKEVFETGAKIATQMGLAELDLPCLFRALLQARDSEIENVAADQKQSLDRIRKSTVPQKEQSPFVLSLATGLKDLDAVSFPSHTPVQIAEALDATLAIDPRRGLDAIGRLAAMGELMWQSGTGGLSDSMLQSVLDQLLTILGKGERGVILVRDSKNGGLLLKACSPSGAVPMISMTSAQQAIAKRKGFIWKRGDDLTLSQKESNVESGMYVPLVVNGETLGVICLDCFCPQQVFGQDDLLLVASFAHQLALAIANHELQSTLKENAKVLERLLTNFSPKIRTRLLQRAQLGRLRLGGEQSIVSVLCADIRGFTRLTAGMPTEDVVSLLNEYFASLTECIFRNEGTVDKFVGDAILAVFGSPEADPQHCRKAIVAAMEMQEAARKVTKQRITRGEVGCEIGIGVHTGEVLHGFIGSAERMEFTIIGDTVNRAARYCDGAKGGEVLISPEIFQRTWNAVEAKQISIPTKHEGDFVAYRVDRVRDRS